MINFLFTKMVSVEPEGNMWGVFEYHNRIEYFFWAWRKFSLATALENIIWLWQHRNEEHAHTNEVDHE